MMSRAIIKAFEELAPLPLAEEWDNSGLLIGSKDKEINRVYIALDATDDVVNDAIENEQRMSSLDEESLNSFKTM